MIDKSTEKYSPETTWTAVFVGLLILFIIIWIPVKIGSLLPDHSDINATLFSTLCILFIAIVMRIRGIIPYKKNGVISQKKLFKRSTATIHISARKVISDPVEIKEISNIIEGVVNEILARSNNGIKTVIIESHLLSFEGLRKKMEKKIQKEIPVINITFVNEKTGWYPFVAIPLFYMLIHWKPVSVYRMSGKLTVHL